MKKAIIIVLALILIFALSIIRNSQKPIDKFSVTSIGLNVNIDEKVNSGDDYVFVMPPNATYNKVYANNVEVLKNLQEEYFIQNITEDIVITFNKQYKLYIPIGLGYTITSISEHADTVNEDETVMFELSIKPDYSNSNPIVKKDGVAVELVDGVFIIDKITEDITITVENVEKNRVIVIPDKTDYTSYSNEDLSWWYRISSPLNSNVKPTIEPSISVLINKYNGLWMINTNEKKIVLTMDEGYEYQSNTTEILDIAKEKGVSITFFITGGYIDKNPELVLRMVNEGHIVANHSDKHLRPSTALNTSDTTFINDIKTLESKFKTLTNLEISRIYRPPEGGYSERSLAIADDLGYKTVFWSFAYRDWLVDDQPNQQEAFDKIISQLHPGAIVLLHAVSDTNVTILGDLIDEIRALGYTFSTIPN